GTYLLQKRKYALAGRVLGIREIHFVFGCRLPREADRVVRGVIAVVCTPAQVRLIEQRALQLVVIVAHLIYGSVLPAERSKEPQLFFFDRTANSSSNVIVFSDRRRAFQAAGAQLVVHVVARQAGACDLNAGRS